MSPLYHLQVGSFLANSRDLNLRERKLVMLAALATDLDGIPTLIQWIVSWLTNRFGLPELIHSNWDELHHTFSHNIFFAALIGFGFALYNRGRKAEMFVLCFASCLVQVVLDNLTNDVSWPIMYFWPAWKFDFGLGNLIAWPHLNSVMVYGVQGVLMVLIFGGTVVLYRRTGRTFIEVLSARLDKLLTDFVVTGFTRRCEVCGRRAFYREAGSGAALCGLHGRIGRDLKITRRDDVEPSGGEAS